MIVDQFLNLVFWVLVLFLKYTLVFKLYLCHQLHTRGSIASQMSDPQEIFWKNIGRFSLYFLENRCDIRLTELERCFVLALHRCYFLYLWIYKRRECEKLPPPCAGTSVELYCILQLFIFIKQDKRRRTTQKFLELHRDEDLRVNYEITDELSGYTTSITNSILEKISRRRWNHNDDTPYFKIYKRDKGNLKLLSRTSMQIARWVEANGHFPVNSRFFRNVWDNLSDEERSAVHILYSQIIWSQYIKNVKYTLPSPNGTGMEIWLMIKLVLEQNGETYPKNKFQGEGLTVGNAYLRAMYSESDGGYDGNPPMDITWVRVKALYQSLAAKASAENQRLNLEKSKERDLIHKRIAFGMSFHDRLGKESKAHTLPHEIVKKIWKRVEEADDDNDNYDSDNYKSDKYADDDDDDDGDDDGDDNDDDDDDVDGSGG